MYMGEPQSVAAIMLLCRYRAKPKSAAGEDTREQGGRGPASLRPTSPTGSGLTNLHTDVVRVGTAPAGVGQQDVLGLQVAMDDALAVQEPHGACNLLQEEPDGVLAQCPHGCGKTGLRGRSSPRHLHKGRTSHPVLLPS